MAATLSFRQAFSAKQSGQISWDTYIHTLLARCTGVKHEDDNVQGTYSKLRRIDPLGHMIWHWSNRMGTIDDASVFEDVFMAYRHKTFDDVKTKLVLLKERPRGGLEGMKQSLALLACQERRADVLKYCLDEGGFPIEATFIEEAERVDADKDPETFNAIQQSRQFQQIHIWDEWNENEKKKRDQEVKKDEKKWKKDENGNLVPCTCGAPRGAEADFDRGGKLPVYW